MKYAIFVDVDGTLLDNKQQIPESAVYAIQNARKKTHTHGNACRNFGGAYVYKLQRSIYAKLYKA